MSLDSSFEITEERMPICFNPNVSLDSISIPDLNSNKTTKTGRGGKVGKEQGIKRHATKSPEGSVMKRRGSLLDMTDLHKDLKADLLESSREQLKDVVTEATGENHT